MDNEEEDEDEKDVTRKRTGGRQGDKHTRQQRRRDI